VATGSGTLSGIAIETGVNGLATKVAAVRIGPNLEESLPHFWE